MENLVNCMNKNPLRRGNCFHKRRRDIPLEINVRGGDQIVEVWLTREEKQDADLRERLKVLYQEYRARKFLVAVFESGEQDLEELTCGLLGYNKKRAVQLEMEREKVKSRHEMQHPQKALPVRKTGRACQYQGRD